MVRLRDLPALFAPVDGKLPPELRVQRTLNKTRVPKIAQYILGNPGSYTFSALTGAIDGLPRFEPVQDGALMGTLYIPRAMTVAMLDGQHRRAALELAVREDNARKRGGMLASEFIAVILFVDGGLEKAQQKFADLNRFAVRPNNSIGLLYDHRDEMAALTRAVVKEVPLFARLTDAEKTSVAGGADRLFALSGIHAATQALLSGSNYKPEESRKVAVAFWCEVARVMHDWQRVAEGELKASELRERSVSAHAVALQAIGRVGCALLRERPDAWREALAGLGTLDWSRANKQWAGRAIVNGKVTKGAGSVVLTANLIKAHLGLELGIEDRRHEGSIEVAGEE